LPCYYGYQQSELAKVANVGLGLGVVISNLGGSSPTTPFAAALAEPSAKMSQKLPNVAPTSPTVPTFPPQNVFGL